MKVQHHYVPHCSHEIAYIRVPLNEEEGTVPLRFIDVHRTDASKRLIPKAQVRGREGQIIQSSSWIGSSFMAGTAESTPLASEVGAFVGSSVRN